MSLTRFAWITGLLPFITINVVWVVSWLEDRPETWCNPYIDGCKTISYAGAEGYAGVIFNALMTVACVYMYQFWRYNRQWMEANGGSPLFDLLSRHPGTAGAISLIFSNATLAIFDEKHWTHVVFAATFFIFMVWAQTAQTIHVWQKLRHVMALPKTYIYGITANVALQYLVIVLYIIDVINGTATDAAEWQLTALIALYFVFSAYAWQGWRSEIVYTPEPSA